MNTTNQALAYAKNGWHVLPVGPKKAPAAGYGLHSSTIDADEIQRIWRENPSAGVAVACQASGLVVLDCDPRNGGNETLEHLCAADPSFELALASTPQVETQGGGKHFYFLAEAGTVYPSQLGAGLDVKHRGYVVAPPSKGQLGQYLWTARKSPKEIPVAAAPRQMTMGKQQVISSPRAKIRAATIITTNETYDELEAALAVIPPEIEYQDWLKVLYGMSRLRLTERAREITRAWSVQSHKPGHTAHAFDAKWASVMKEHAQTSYETVFYLAKRFDRGRQDDCATSVGGLPKRGNPLLQPIRHFSDDETNAAELQPRVLVENYLYADLRNLIAAGGVGKTTMLLHEAVCGALGRPIWGNNVPAAFTTVFVTKEDPREIFAGRLRELMREMALTDDERGTVYARVFVVDLAGSSYKLAQLTGGQVTPHEQNLDALVNHCLPIAPDRIVFDPLVSFTVGEGHVNDAEQGVVEAARYLMRRIPDVAVDIVHHTGKANARLGAMDQYAGRNGSALPDGSRMVAVVIKCSSAVFLAETGYPLNEVGGETGLRVAFPKMSYGVQPPDFFIRRLGFRFEVMPTVTQERRAEIQTVRKAADMQETLEATKTSIMRAMQLARDSQDPLDRYPSRSRVMELGGVVGKKVNRNKALDELLNDGLLGEAAIGPEELLAFPIKSVLSSRRTYISIEPDES